MNGLCTRLDSRLDSLEKAIKLMIRNSSRTSDRIRLSRLYKMARAMRDENTKLFDTPNEKLNEYEEV